MFKEAGCPFVFVVALKRNSIGRLGLILRVPSLTTRHYSLLLGCPVNKPFHEPDTHFHLKGSAIAFHRYGQHCFGLQRFARGQRERLLTSFMDLELVF